MKLRIINPDSGIDEAGFAARIKKLTPLARPDTELSMVCPQKNNLCIDSWLDEALDAGEIVELALQAQRDGCDAVGLYCFNDPAINACRELLDIPVVGAGQSSILLACQVALSYSVLTTSERGVPQSRHYLREVGGDPSRLASLRGVEIPPRSDLSREQIIDILSKVGRKCVEEDGANAVVLGCLSFAAMGRELTQMLGVPVIDPAVALISAAETLASQGLCHSKISWLTPPQVGERYWGAGRV